jgi:hypothetical protein
MTRILLIPTRTADGRHIILRAVVASPLQRLREALRRALPA